jgi:hypothetical protein
LTLPTEIAAACAPLFEAVPFETAMGKLVGSAPQQTEVVKQVLQNPALANRPELATALWLYVDDLDRSHTISQGIDGSTGAYWHGIMHRREGDFGNSHYWMRQAAAHPLRRSHPELDPDALIDAVAAARGSDKPDLVARQRAEWKTLFEWCAAQP